MDLLKYFVDCDRELVELAARGICPRCGGRHSIRTVQYADNPSKHKCNVACLTARGRLCECGCGGKNHGAGFIMSERLFA